MSKDEVFGMDFKNEFNGDEKGKNRLFKRKNMC